MKFHSLIAVSLITVLASGLALAEDKPRVAIFDLDIAPTVKTEVTIIDTTGTGSTSVTETKTTNVLTDKLVTNFVQSAQVVVIERKKIAKIMQEATLSESDLVDPSSAMKIGKLLGADYMLFGSISVWDGQVKMKALPYNAGIQKISSFAMAADVRLVNTESGKIIAAVSMQAEDEDKHLNPPEDDRLLPQTLRNDVLNELAHKISGRTLSTIDPIKVAQYAGGIVYLDRGNLEKGTRLSVVKVGEVIRNPDDPEEIIGQIETPLAVIKVDAGLKKMSKGSVVNWAGSEQQIPVGSVCRPADIEE